MDFATFRTMGTTSVPECGRAVYNIGRDASYEAAARGEIPTIRVGRRLRVPVWQILAQLAGQPIEQPLRTVVDGSLDTETDSDAGVVSAGVGNVLTLPKGARHGQHAPINSD
jgi:hypothetical protein